MTSCRLESSAASPPGNRSDQGRNRPADRGSARLHLRPLLRPRVILPVLFGLVVVLLSWNHLRGPVLPGYRIESAPLVQNVAEYLQEEGRDVPSRTEAEEFLQGVDKLRDDVDRLEARLKLLEKRHA